MSEVAQRCNFDVGDVIGDHYQVNKVLGEGSFGKVYSVFDDRGVKLALKLLKLWEVHPDIREALVKRFDMEFETGRIDSDFLVHSLSHGFIQGNPYIIMEYCPGGDLINLSKKQQLDYSKVAICVLRGLNALHKRGKVHRDLKPENVLLKTNGIYALTDFGISGDRNKRMTERNILGKPKQIFGTYAYMPPEQLKPRKDATVLPTTDIFSFGVMMFQLLTKELPFGRLEDEADLASYLRRGRMGEWNKNALSTIPSGHQWIALIDRCLKPDFKQRAQNVEEVISLVPIGLQVKEPVIQQIEENDFQTHIVNGVLLRIMQGEEYGKVYRLDDLLGDHKSVLTMGRSDYGVKNDIAIAENDSSYISRKHCTLELDYDSGNWVIRDGQWDKHLTGGGWKKSTNGTYVNSKEVPEFGLPFFPGDIISIGDTKLRVEAY